MRNFGDKEWFCEEDTGGKDTLYVVCRHVWRDSERVEQDHHYFNFCEISGGSVARRVEGEDGLFHGNKHSTAWERETRGARICDDSSIIQNEKGDFIGFFAHFLPNHHKFAERAPGN